MFVSQIFDECAEILGTTDKSKVFRKISQAVQALMESGHWTHSTAEVDVCTGWDGCSIALPRGVSVPLTVNVDGSPVYFRNRLFQYHVNAGGMFNPVEWAWDDRGYVATLMEIIQPSELVAVAESNNDVGKTIRVVGTDNLNRQIRSQLPDGTGVDGLLVPINSISDFVYGAITPSGANVVTRETKATPIQTFKTTTEHQLNSGQGMVVTALSGTIPIPMVEGKTYYIGVIDAFTIKIFNDSLNAQSGNYPISLQSIVNSDLLQFLDQRESQVVTSLQFKDENGSTIEPEISIDTANPIFFSPNQQLPAPLKNETTYFGNLLDKSNIQIFENEDNAENNFGEIYTTGSTEIIEVDIRKKIAPETKLTFIVPHLYQDGDQVQAFTTGGVLPKPLIQNENYFVNIIDNFNITLHENQADANASSNDFFVNPIIFTTTGSGVFSLIKLIPATITVGKTNQITATGLSIQTPSGAGAQFNAVAVGSVTTVRIQNGGSGYGQEPNVVFSDPPQPPEGQTARTAKGYAIRNTISNAISEIVILDPGQGYISAPTVTIDDPVITSFSVESIVIDPTAPTTAKVTTSANHGFENSTKILISNATPSAYNGVKTISNVTEKTFTYPIALSTTSPAGGTGITAQRSTPGQKATATATITLSSISKFVKVSGGSGYTEIPQVKIEGGGGTGATAKANISNGEVDSIDIITQGTGYSSTIAPIVKIEPSTGVFVEFQSVGTLPQPITAGTAYRAENPTTNNVFTIKNTDYSDFDVKSSGSGNLFVVLSRAFEVEYTGNWRGNFNSLNQIQGFYFGTDFILPITSPSIDNGATKFWLKKDTNDFGRVYTTELLAELGGTDGKIITTTLGTGQSYYGIRYKVKPSVYENLIEPTNIEYIGENELVEFSSSGTLPAPLIANKQYSVQLFGNRVKAYDNGNLVNILTPGTGKLNLNIRREMKVSPSTSLDAPSCLYETGQKVTVRANENDVLPVNLSSGITYFVRKINKDTFELYDTLVNAENILSQKGRIEFLTTGDNVSSYFFVDSIQGPVLVKNISHIEKPKTEGYVSLYAWDYGRNNDLTLIGQYHPDEINPQYRRIRIGKNCAWARIAYRLTPPNVTNIYDFIPLEHERAIITAVHACDLEDKDFAEQATRYWGIAFQYLKSQQEHIDGHAFSPPQIQNIVYADGEEPVMF